MVPVNAIRSHQPDARDEYCPIVGRYSGHGEECSPQPVRGQARNHHCPIAKTGDAGKEEISGANKEVERKARKQKKAKSNRSSPRAAQCNPKHQRGREVRKGFPRSSKAGVEVAGPRDLRQYTRLCVDAVRFLNIRSFGARGKTSKK